MSSTGLLEVAGDLSGSIKVGETSGDLAGDITIGGDYSGRLDVRNKFSGSLYIGGDVTDSSAPMYVYDLDGGTLSCESLHKAGPLENRVMFGFYENIAPNLDLDIVQNGSVEVRDTLSGAIYFRAQTEAQVTIGTVDANQTDGADAGGIFSYGGYLPGFDLHVTGDFLNGGIYAQGTTDGAALPGSADVRRGIDGSFRIDGDFGGATTVTRFMCAFLDVAPDLSTCDGSCPNLSLDGIVSIGGDLYTADSNAVVPAWYVSGNLNGQILIDGSLIDDSDAEPEIDIDGVIASTGAIAIDYDGYDAADTWESGAEIDVGASTFTGNSPANAVYEITPCKGDMNNDGVVDSSDGTTTTGPFATGRDNPSTYSTDFPGLAGSRVYHGDVNFDTVFDAADNTGFITINSLSCCIERWNCPGDLDLSGDVDLADLSGLLGNFGATSAAPGDGDIDGDGDVDLGDLAGLLAAFGNNCPTDCNELNQEGGGFGGFGPLSSPVDLSIEAFDTGGYSGGGFEGEDEHFVFDLIIEVLDPNDDWMAAGMAIATDNDAVLRFAGNPTDPNASPPPVPEPNGVTAPEKYVTFVGVPKLVNSSGRFSDPGGLYAGGYAPLAAAPSYSTTSYNVVWFDNATSDDGPAAVLRVVIDVSAVSGADTSSGLGAVYFSQTGPTTIGDIVVAEIDAAFTVASTGQALQTITGEFYVKH